MRFVVRSLEQKLYVIRYVLTTDITIFREFSSLHFMHPKFNVILAEIKASLNIAQLCQKVKFEVSLYAQKPAGV